MAFAAGHLLMLTALIAAEAWLDDRRGKPKPTPDARRRGGAILGQVAFGFALGLGVQVAVAGAVPAGLMFAVAAGLIGYREHATAPANPSDQARTPGTPTS